MKFDNITPETRAAAGEFTGYSTARLAEVIETTRAECDPGEQQRHTAARVTLAERQRTERHRRRINAVIRRRQLEQQQRGARETARDR